jgi:hypothetical protein
MIFILLNLVQVFGSNTNGSTVCTFPFIYKEKSYYECITQDRDNYWCSVTLNYDIDGLWGYCKGTYHFNLNPKRV